MHFSIKILFVFLCLFVLAFGVHAQVRVIDNKGTFHEIDNSKWWLEGNNIYNKNSQNVIIGEPRTYVPTSRFTVSGTSSLPALKLKYPFSGALTDSILTWNSTDSIVRKISIAKLTDGDWHTHGNSGTNPALSFIGTTDNNSLNFRVNNLQVAWLGTEATGSNVSFGLGALTKPTRGYYNVAIGLDALSVNIANSNVAIGGYALGKNISGFNNTAVGYLTLLNNTSGESNTAFGVGSLQKTNANSNVGIGGSSGAKNVTGFGNVFIGANADALADNLNYATAIGNAAIVGASNSMVLGVARGNAGGRVPTKVGIGVTAPSNTLHIVPGIAGDSPVRIEGLQAGAVTDKVVVADASGLLKTVDPSTLAASTSWSTTGNSGTNEAINFIGTSDSKPIILGVNNVRVGKISEGSGIGTTNIYFGKNSGAGDVEVSNAKSNVGIGDNSLMSNTTGSNNTGISFQALYSNTTGSYNIGIGEDALFYNTAGGDNSAIGRGAGFNNVTGSNNIFIGAITGGEVGTDVKNSVFLGVGARLKLGTMALTNSVAIGYKAIVNADYTIVLGAAGTRVAIGADSVTGTETLYVSGTIKTAAASYPDYVFENYLGEKSNVNPAYSLKSLKEVEAFITENKHLPGVTGIKELTKNEKGEYVFDITELSVQSLEKIEELYVHSIEQQKQLEAKDRQIAEMNSRLERLEKMMEIDTKK